MNTDETQIGLRVDHLQTLMPHEDVTEAVIGAAFDVHNELGYGFLERVYQKAMQAELIRRGFKAEIEHAIRVEYKGVVIGEYSADLLVNDSVMVELKVASDYDTRDEAQLLNELKATNIKVGLLVNFGRTKVRFKRLVF